jgi:preprotein translocase subunit SecF
MREIVKNTNINFMGWKKYCFIISGILASLGIFALVQIWAGNANLGVDFAGGTSVQIKFSQAVNLHEVRLTLEGAGLKDFDLQDLPSENKVLVRVKKQDDTVGKASEQITQILNEKFADKKPVIDQTIAIGPKVGSRLRDDAMLAVVMAAAGILIYIAFRFRILFGIGATIATFHDVLAVLGIFWLLDKEINLILITALLTIAGYSLTDTVVVFDRVRENLKRFLKDAVHDVINRSINEVLSRTIVTSLTVFLSALALFLFGGEVLHDFALAMLIGVVIGTYSSVFIASPVVIFLSKDKNPLSAKKA